MRIRELTVEDEARIKTQAQVWDSKRKSHVVDQSRLDCAIIVASVLPETWPADFGSLTIESVKIMPTKYVRPILLACQKLNVLEEDVSDFLESQSQSGANPTISQRQ